jgi:divalent anion:Na+ symporter, DASS family
MTAEPGQSVKGSRERVFCMSAKIEAVAPEKGHPKKKNSRYLSLLAVVALATVIWSAPAPVGVELKVWHLLAIFIATVFGIILKPFPMGAIAIDRARTALVGLGVLLIKGVLTWKDILAEEKDWDTLVWFAALVMMASSLNELGLIPGGVDWTIAFPVLCLIYFYSHYLFASQTAHVSSMYGAFLSVSVAVGAPPLLAALVLGFSSNLFSSLANYGSGPAPILFGPGYVELGTWWMLGALISVINIGIWLILGGLRWKLLGLR